MDTIAEYSERRHDGTQDFKLFADRLEIKGKEYLGADYHTTVLLKTLAPEIDRFRSRSNFFGIGCYMLFLPAAVAFVLVDLFDVPPFTTVTSLFWALTLCGAFILFATLRKESYAVFKTTSGVAAVTLSKEGKQTDRFEDFLRTLQKQIVVARDGEQGASPNGGPAAHVDNSGAPGGPPSVS